MARIKIQRKRKPLLHGTTTRLFHLGDLCTRILTPIARYGGAMEKDAYMRVQIENRAQDTRVKSEREAKLVAENQRLELQNIAFRLELEQKYGPEKVARLLGEPAPKGSDEFDDIPHTI